MDGLVGGSTTSTHLDHYGIEEGRYKEDNVRLVKAHIGSMLLNEMVPERSDPDEIRSNQNSDLSRFISPSMPLNASCNG